MILSNENLFSDGQAVTAAAAATNVIDLGERGTPYGAKTALPGDIGKGNPVQFLVQLSDDFDGDDLQVEVLTGTASGAVTTVAATLKATLAKIKEAGFRFPVIYLPNGISDRYLTLKYTPGGTPTKGTVTAGITLGVQTNQVDQS